MHLQSATHCFGKLRMLMLQCEVTDFKIQTKLPHAYFNSE